jgi:uncharacterized protein involved in cysteine biosynthesis
VDALFLLVPLLLFVVIPAILIGSVLGFVAALRTRRHAWSMAETLRFEPAALGKIACI